MNHFDYTGYFSKVASDMSIYPTQDQASVITDFSGMYNEVVKEAAAGVIGKSSFKFLGSKFTTDAPGRMMRYAQSNPMSAMGRAAAAGAVGTWAMKK